MDEYLSRSKDEIFDEAKKAAAVAKESMDIVNQSKIIEKSIGTITHDVNRQSETIFSYLMPTNRDHQEFAISIYARNGYFS